MDIAALKREIKLEIIRELQLTQKTCEYKCHPLRRSQWYDVHEYLVQRVLEVEEYQSRGYWRLFESIRNLMRPTFGIQRVEYLKAEDVPVAMKLVDDVINGVKKAREAMANGDNVS